jgi:hypothetical protein
MRPWVTVSISKTFFKMQTFFIGNKLNSLNINEMRESKDGTCHNHNKKHIYYYSTRTLKGGSGYA